jgi:MFS family permease
VTTTTATLSRDASWTERGATFAVFFALGLATGAWATALPGLKTNLGLSDQGLSLALLAVSVGSVGSTLLAGAVAPRIGTGRATALAGIALAVAIALPAFAASLPMLVAFAFLFGITGGFLDVSMNGHASEVERRWGSAIMSSFHGAFSLGGLGGATLGGVIAGAGFGPLGQLTIAAAVTGATTVLAGLNLGPGSKSEPENTGLVWPERAVWALCLIALFCLLIEGAMADWTAVYLTTVANVSAGTAAAGYAAFSVTMTVGRLTGDQVVRRLGPRVVMVGGGLIAALGLAASVAAPALVPATVGFALVGLGLSNITPTVFSAAGRFGRTPAAGMAMVVSCGYVGFISGPPLIGAIASIFSLRIALGTLVLIAAAVIVSGARVRTAPD